MSADDRTPEQLQADMEAARVKFEEWHDHRDRHGRPIEKRDAGAASDWANRPDGYQPGERK